MQDIEIEKANTTLRELKKVRTQMEHARKSINKIKIGLEKLDRKVEFKEKPAKVFGYRGEGMMRTLDLWYAQLNDLIQQESTKFED